MQCYIAAICLPLQPVDCKDRNLIRMRLYSFADDLILLSTCILLIEENQNRLQVDGSIRKKIMLWKRDFLTEILCLCLCLCKENKLLSSKLERLTTSSDTGKNSRSTEKILWKARLKERRSLLRHSAFAHNQGSYGRRRDIKPRAAESSRGKALECFWTRRCDSQVWSKPELD